MTGTRRAWISGLAVAGLLCTTWLLLRPASSSAVNVLLITLDTTRFDRLGCYGSVNVDTPALDSLAAQGCLFERAYAPAPLTLPSHASLMTGLYPPEHGLRVNGKHQLGSEMPVLAERLQRLGYRTGAFVGAFVLDKKFGLSRGFEQYDDTMDESRILYHGEVHAEHEIRSGEHVVDAALHWLRKSDRRPFFGWVHLYDPHAPYSVREELFGERYRDRPYDAGIAYVDRQVGRLLEFLRRQRMDKRTIVVVVGDHGESLGDHQERDHGYTVYNSTLQVPLIVRWAGQDAPVRRIAAPVSLVDVFPTLTAILDPAESLSSSGRSFWPACAGEDPPAATYYAESDQPQEEGIAAPLRCLVTDRWKYIRSPRPELYDLVDDPREVRNLAEQQPQQTEQLEQALQLQESAFVRRDAVDVFITSKEQRALASLGYAGGGGAAVENQPSLPDIKEMLPLFNAYCDAQERMAANSFPQAQESLEQVVRGAPHYFKAWFNLGACRHKLGDNAGAISAFQKVVELEDNSPVRIALGKIFLAQNAPQQAQPHLARAVELNPESAEASFLLGIAFLQLKDLAGARRSFEQAIEIDGEFYPARQQLERLP